MKQRIQLPSRLSDLLEIGLRDYMKVRRIPKLYRIDMSEWHLPTTRDPIFDDDGYIIGYRRKKEICSVCMAGAIMAMTFHIPHDVIARPSTSRFFNNDDYVKLSNIDLLRRGKVSDVTLQHKHRYLNRKIVQPQLSHYKFKRGIKKLINDLKEAGL